MRLVERLQSCAEALLEMIANKAINSIAFFIFCVKNLFIKQAHLSTNLQKVSKVKTVHALVMRMTDFSSVDVEPCTYSCCKSYVTQRRTEIDWDSASDQNAYSFADEHFKFDSWANAV